MPIAPIPIANGFYESDSLPISAQECSNWYPNIVQTTGLEQRTLFGSAGIEQLTTSGKVGEINRGAHVKNGIPYFVNGNSLYRVDRAEVPGGTESFSMVNLGVVSGSGRVSMADNGKQLMILVPGGDAYIYDESESTPLQEITDLDFPASGAPQYVVFVDSYFACSTNSKKWIVSANNDGLSWNALDFGSAESDPDKIVAPVVFRNQLFITGSETTEAFQNLPNGAGFPFVRSNIFLDKGCFAPSSIITANGTFMMIGGGINESPAIWQFTGSGFQKISTTAIDSVLSSFSDAEISGAFSYSYAVKGAYFIGFTVGNRTFEINTVTNLWNERKSDVDGNESRWRVNSMVTAYGRVLVGDSIDGRIGELSPDIYTEYGGNIRRIISTQPFSHKGQEVKVSMLELTTESGVGNDLAANPQVAMDYSDNGGKTFKPRLTRSLGKIGEYDARAIWYRLGSFSRYRIFRWELTDPVKPVIIGATAEIS